MTRFNTLTLLVTVIILNVFYNNLQSNDSITKRHCYSNFIEATNYIPSMTYKRYEIFHRNPTYLKPNQYNNNILHNLIIHEHIAEILKFLVNCSNKDLLNQNESGNTPLALSLYCFLRNLNLKNYGQAKRYLGISKLILKALKIRGIKDESHRFQLLLTSPNLYQLIQSHLS